MKSFALKLREYPDFFLGYNNLIMQIRIRNVKGTWDVHNLSIFHRLM